MTSAVPIRLVLPAHQPVHQAFTGAPSGRLTSRFTGIPWAIGTSVGGLLTMPIPWIAGPAIIDRLFYRQVARLLL